MLFSSSPPLPPALGLVSGIGKASSEDQYLPQIFSRQQGWWKFPAPSFYGRVQLVACVCYLNKEALESEGRPSPRSCWLLKHDALLLIRPVYDRFHKCFTRPWWLHRRTGWWQLPPTLCVRCWQKIKDQIYDPDKIGWIRIPNWLFPCFLHGWACCRIYWQRLSPESQSFVWIKLVPTSTLLPLGLAEIP